MFVLGFACCLCTEFTRAQVLRLGNIVPDFKAETTQGPMEWHKWIEGSWAILFSHPADFTVRPSGAVVLHVVYKRGRLICACAGCSQSAPQK